MQRERNPPIEFLVWNPLTCFRLQISLKANQSHLLKSVIVWDFPTPTDVIVIKLSPFLYSWGKQKYHRAKKQTINKYENKSNKQNKTEQVIPRHMLSWKILSQIILLRWHQQIRPTSLAFLSSLLNDVIMVVAKDNLKNLWH